MSEENTSTTKPKIFIYTVPDGQDIIGYALAEDGTALAAQYCSHRIYARFDMGLTSRKKHEYYNAHYPDGYELVDLVDATGHDLMANKAFVFALEKNKENNPDEESLSDE